MTTITPPTVDHELYAIHAWTHHSGSVINKRISIDLPTCKLCDAPVLFGWEVAYRLKGSTYADRKFLYVHKSCLKPMKTEWK